MSILSATRRPRALRSARPGVPWLTVATLALGLSCTTAFWLVSLEGAIGSPQRFATPFATWLMLVVTLLPFFGAGVLAMLMLARHWFGPEPRFPDKVALTGLLLAAGGTLLGIAALAVSAVYDYHLQVPHIGGMQGMAPCTGSCVPREQHEIFVLHVRGVWMVGRWLLLSNAVLVTWLVAMWGGRIKLTTSCADEVAALQVAPARAGGLRRDVRLLLVGALVGAAIIHAAVMPEHLDEWTRRGRVLRRPDRWPSSRSQACC